MLVIRVLLSLTYVIIHHRTEDALEKLSLRRKLAAVIPVTLYPILGGKVWCRYWCPLAKWMQLWSRWFGRLWITSNDKCITCGECSRYCLVGIDVMGFAKNQQELSNNNSSCIHCGICVTVCPMDVLSFDNHGTGTITAARQAAVMPTVEGRPLDTSGVT